jgi:hypothetical protein
MLPEVPIALSLAPLKILRLSCSVPNDSVNLQSAPAPLAIFGITIYQYLCLCNIRKQYNEYYGCRHCSCCHVVALFGLGRLHNFKAKCKMGWYIHSLIKICCVDLAQN